MNQSQIAGKWKEIKGELRKAWGDLTDDEVEQTKGNMESISGLIQQKFGLTKDQAKERLEKVYSKFEDKTEEYKNNLREENERNRDRLN